MSRCGRRSHRNRTDRTGNRCYDIAARCFRSGANRFEPVRFIRCGLCELVLRCSRCTWFWAVRPSAAPEPNRTGNRCSGIAARSFRSGANRCEPVRFIRCGRCEPVFRCSRCTWFWPVQPSAAPEPNRTENPFSVIRCDFVRLWVHSEKALFNTPIFRTPLSGLPIRTGLCPDFSA